MAIARISGQAGGATGSGVSSVSDTYGVNVTAGSLLTIICARGNYPTTADAAIVLGDLTKTGGTATISAITLDRQAHETLGGFDANIAVFSCIVLTTGSCTFTLAGTVSGEMFASIGIEEHTGSWNSSRVVGTNQAWGTTGAPSTDFVTTTASALLIAGVVTSTGSVTTHTQDSPWLLTYEQEDGTSTLTCSLVSYVAPSATTIEATWSAPTTIPGSAIIVAYQEANAPIITSQPTNQSSYVGLTATFSVTATGATSYQWNLGGAPISSATSSSYTTPVLTLAYNGGVYTVNCISSGGTTVSSSATLTVNPIILFKQYANGAFQSPKFVESAGIAMKMSANLSVTTGGLVQTTTDDFNRADTTASDLGANWLTLTGLSQGGQILSNKASAVATQVCRQLLNVALADDQWAQATVANTNYGAVGLILRGDAGVADGYFFDFWGIPAGGIEIYYRQNSGTTTSIANTALDVANTAVLGDVIRATAIGNVLTAYINGVAKLSVSNTSLMNGVAGIFLDASPSGPATDATIDNFIAGNVTSSSTTVYGPAIQVSNMIEVAGAANKLYANGTYLTSQFIEA